MLLWHKERLITTADATTGPANGPLPTSSTPAIKASSGNDNPSSRLKVGNSFNPRNLSFWGEYFPQACDQREIYVIFVYKFLPSLFAMCFVQT